MLPFGIRFRFLALAWVGWLLALPGKAQSPGTPPTQPEGVIIVTVSGLDQVALTVMDGLLEEPILFANDDLRRIAYRPLTAEGALSREVAGNLSAVGTGKRTGSQVLGLNEAREVTPNLVETATEAGMAWAVITAGELTDPLVAAFYSHQSNILNQRAIGEDLLRQKPGALMGSYQGMGRLELLEEKLKGSGYHVENEPEAIEAFKPREAQALLFDKETSQEIFDDNENYYGEALISALSTIDQRKGKGLVLVGIPGLDYAVSQQSADKYYQQIKTLDKTLETIVAQAISYDMLCVILCAAPGKARISQATHLDANYQFNWALGQSLQLLPGWVVGPGAEAFSPLMSNDELYPLLENAMRQISE